jgi:hypothetical protein
MDTKKWLTATAWTGTTAHRRTRHMHATQPQTAVAHSHDRAAVASASLRHTSAGLLRLLALLQQRRLHEQELHLGERLQRDAHLQQLLAHVPNRLLILS